MTLTVTLLMMAMGTGAQLISSDCQGEGCDMDEATLLQKGVGELRNGMPDGSKATLLQKGVGELRNGMPDGSKATIPSIMQMSVNGKLTVSGAGTQSANGIYFVTPQKESGQMTWQKKFQEMIFYAAEPSWAPPPIGGSWWIQNAAKTPLYYSENTDGGTSPPLNGWSAFNDSTDQPPTVRPKADCDPACAGDEVCTLNIEPAPAPAHKCQACNWQCYLGRYADLQAAYGSNVTAAKDHFASNGATEGRDCTCAAPGCHPACTDGEVCTSTGCQASPCDETASGEPCQFPFTVEHYGQPPQTFNECTSAYSGGSYKWCATKKNYKKALEENPNTAWSKCTCGGDHTGCYDDDAWVTMVGKTVGVTLRDGCREAAAMGLCKHPLYGKKVKEWCCLSCS